MRVKTFLKFIVNGKSYSKNNSGTAGITITLDADTTPPQIFIEHVASSKGEMITMLTDLLLMVEDRYKGEGIVENALKYFFEQSGKIDDNGLVHLQHKRKENK